MLKVMTEDYRQRITQLPLFKGFTVHGAQRIVEAGEIKNHHAGTVLMSEGDEATFVLLVLTGKLEVFVEREGKDLILTEAGPGSILGELAVVCGITRSASVRAREESVVLEWSDDSFRNLLLRDPSLSQRVFRQALRTLLDQEQTLIDSLIATQSGGQA